MSIPVRSVVSVNISVAAQFPTAPGFGTLAVFTTEDGLISGKGDLYRAQRIKAYSGPDEVANDWETSSEAYKAANTYFAQRPRPETVKIALRQEAAVSAILIGSVIDDDATNLADFTAINDGSFRITIDSDTQDITGLDFSTDADLSDVAATVQAGLQAIGSGGYTAATCTYNAVDQRFVITSGTTGDSSTITTLSIASSGTDVSALLRMDAGNGISLNGSDAETVTDSLNNVENVDNDWYGFSFTKEVREAVMINGESAVENAAFWAESRVKIFFNTTNDPNSLVSGGPVTIAQVLNTQSFRRSTTVYSSFPDQYPAASVAGRAFTVDFNQPDSTITLKFKQLPTITVENLSTTQKNALDAINCNAYILVGNTEMFAESFMADGSFLDELHNIDWLTADLQTQVFGYTQTRPTKVPYTDPGTSALEQQMRVSLDRAVTNGMAAPGETNDGRFLAQGYEISVLPVADVAQSEVTDRNYPGLSFVILGAGAIHGIQINGIYER